MGEYYCWANINKKQCMWGIDFDYGSKYLEAMSGGNTLLLALHSLLNEEWLGDIIGVSDERPNDYKLLESLAIKI